MTAARHAPRELAPLTTINELARRRGVPTRTMFDRIRRLFEGDRQRGPEHTRWLFRQKRGPWSVNESWLRFSHPEFYDAPDTRELESRVVELAEKLRESNRKQNALHAAFREHRKVHQQIETLLRQLLANGARQPYPSGDTERT